MSGFEDLNIEPIRVPSPEAVEAAVRKHALDAAVIDQIKNADLEKITAVIDQINTTISQRPEILREDLSIQEKMREALQRLADLTKPQENPGTLH